MERVENLPPIPTYNDGHVEIELWIQVHDDRVDAELLRDLTGSAVLARPIQDPRIPMLGLLGVSDRDDVEPELPEFSADPLGEALLANAVQDLDLDALGKRALGRLEGRVFGKNRSPLSPERTDEDAGTDEDYGGEDALEERNKPRRTTFGLLF